jgi:hypothetical protein
MPKEVTKIGGFSFQGVGVRVAFGILLDVTESLKWIRVKGESIQVCVRGKI